MPATKARHWSAETLRAARRASGTSRYSVSKSSDTAISDVRKIRFKAVSGTPPKANAETRTPVSTTALGLAMLSRVLRPSNFPDGGVDVLRRKSRTAESLTRDAQSGFQSIFGREGLKDVFLGRDWTRAGLHGPLSLSLSRARVKFTHALSAATATSRAVMDSPPLTLGTVAGEVLLKVVDWRE